MIGTIAIANEQDTNILSQSPGYINANLALSQNGISFGEYSVSPITIMNKYIRQETIINPIISDVFDNLLSSEIILKNANNNSEIDSEIWIILAINVGPSKLNISPYKSIYVPIKIIDVYGLNNDTPIRSITIWNGCTWGINLSKYFAVNAIDNNIPINAISKTEIFSQE